MNHPYNSTKGEREKTTNPKNDFNCIEIICLDDSNKEYYKDRLQDFNIPEFMTKQKIISQKTHTKNRKNCEGMLQS